MGLKQQIDSDLKTAMLAGNKQLVTTLRTLKSAIQYAEVGKGRQAEGLSDPEIADLLSKEAKKRQESADIYGQAGEAQRKNSELAEKAVIDGYLPKAMTEAELAELVKQVINETPDASAQKMGQIIGAVKQRSHGAADGSAIAAAVKKALGI